MNTFHLYTSLSFISQLHLSCVSNYQSGTDFLCSFHPGAGQARVDFLFYLSLMKLVLFFSFLLFFVLLAACSNSVVNKKLSGSDSLVINFKEQITDSVTQTVTTTEK